ncbi:hypothetical protein [Pelagibius sp. Alg239-R121]|uniref:hypothetical protein n=1 Tax=Pelagibius sp. Alg239-R121 TaxID=2993448 RepID=UPI0024A63E13|nr:hypothetical protein [Pelagibius sp. Alg239-R121]
MVDSKAVNPKSANRNSGVLKPAVDQSAATQSVATYKQILREFIDRRPSGTRQRIAKALGTHKSFVSQITNPALRVPLPAPHVASIFKICHFSPEERGCFLDAYRIAHPNQAAALESEEVSGKRIVMIELPDFEDPGKQERLAEAIEDIAAKMIALAREGG